MDDFELTDEQRAQLAAGNTYLTLTPEQEEYMERLDQAEEGGRDKNVAWARQWLLFHTARRVRALEGALKAILDGRPDEARDLLEKKHEARQ